MKKTLKVFICLLMCAAMTACGTSSNTATSNKVNVNKEVEKQDVGIADQYMLAEKYGDPSSTDTNRFNFYDVGYGETGYLTFVQITLVYTPELKAALKTDDSNNEAYTKMQKEVAYLKKTSGKYFSSKIAENAISAKCGYYKSLPYFWVDVDFSNKNFNVNAKEIQAVLKHYGFDELYSKPANAYIAEFMNAAWYAKHENVARFKNIFGYNMLLTKLKH